MAEIAVWDGTVTADNTVLLGADASWAGIRIANPGGAVVISPGNPLTLGASGVDLSLATQPLTLNNPVVLGAAQTWNVAMNLTAGGAVSGTNRLTKSGNGLLVLGVANTYSGGTTINGGVVQINAAAAAGTGGGITNNDGTTLRFGAAVGAGNVFTANGNVTVDVNRVGGNAALLELGVCDPARIQVDTLR